MIQIILKLILTILKVHIQVLLIQNQSNPKNFNQNKTITELKDLLDQTISEEQLPEKGVNVDLILLTIYLRDKDY